MRRRRDQADVAVRLAARRVIGLDDQQSRVLALRAGVGLQRDRRVAGDRAEHALELGDHLAIADRLVGRRERMDVRELAPRDRDHLARRVELHRARAERDHRAVEREVLVGEAAQVAQHLGLGVIAIEGRVREERRRAAQAPAARRRLPSARSRRNRAARRPRRAKIVHSSAHVVARRRLVERDADVRRRRSGAD